MKIIHIEPQKITIGEKDIEQDYFSFSTDMENYRLCQKVIQTFNQNGLLFFNYKKVLNELNNEVALYTCNLNLYYVQVKQVIESFLNNLQPFLSEIRSCIGKDLIKEITNSVYDNYDGYQFCYELRNVLQHKGLKIRIAYENDSLLTVYVDKKDLLEDINIKPLFRKRLGDYPEKIELCDKLDNFYEAQREIIHRAYQALYDENAHKRLIEFHSQNAVANDLPIGACQKTKSKEGLEIIKYSIVHFDRDKITENMNFQKKFVSVPLVQDKHTPRSHNPNFSE